MKTAFPFQVKGTKFLAGKNLALLADSMGLGKTRQAIEALDLIQAAKIVILCPAVARLNWVREINEFAMLGRRTTVFKTQDQILSPEEKYEVVICSYDLAEFLVPQIESIDVLICDESHYLKNGEAQRTQFLLGKQGLAHKTKRIWMLSGTPAPNHVGELWPMFFTFGLTKLRYLDFITKFCKTKQTSFGVQIFGSKDSTMGEIREMLSKIMLRRRTDDVLDLPPVFSTTVYLEGRDLDFEISSSLIMWVFPRDRRKEYFDLIAKEEAYVKETLERLPPRTKGEPATDALELISGSITKLREYNGARKVEEVGNLINKELEDDAYDKIVIFAIHQHVIDALRVRLKNHGAVTLYGGTPPETRQKNIDRFQKDPKCRVFIGNIQAAGVAITLTAAAQVAFVELDWVPGNNLQALYRLRRIGQKRRIHARYFTIADSIDEKITDALKRKTEELRKVFDQEEENMRVHFEGEMKL